MANLPHRLANRAHRESPSSPGELPLERMFTLFHHTCMWLAFLAPRMTPATPGRSSTHLGVGSVWGVKRCEKKQKNGIRVWTELSHFGSRFTPNLMEQPPVLPPNLLPTTPLHPHLPPHKLREPARQRDRPPPPSYFVATFAMELSCFFATPSSVRSSSWNQPHPPRSKITRPYLPLELVSILTLKNEVWEGVKGRGDVREGVGRMRGGGDVRAYL